jgi:hypothetical protein
MSYVQLSEQISKRQWRPECVICKESVELAQSKTDEHGQAVHEECYVSQFVSRRSDPSRPPLRYPPNHIIRQDSF